MGIEFSFPDDTAPNLELVRQLLGQVAAQASIPITSIEVRIAGGKTAWTIGCHPHDNTRLGNVVFGNVLCKMNLEEIAEIKELG